MKHNRLQPPTPIPHSLPFPSQGQSKEQSSKVIKVQKDKQRHAQCMYLSREKSKE
jgi:hypothetical protein